MNPMRIVFVAQAPVPAHTIVLNELAKLVDLHVVYMVGRRDAQIAEHSWASFRDPWHISPQFRHSFHWSRALRVSRIDLDFQVSAGVSVLLRRLEPDVLIVHGWGPLMIEPLAWKVKAHRRAVMWTESTAGSGLLRQGTVNWIRMRLLRYVDAFISNGTKATEFALSLGVPANRVITSCMPTCLEVSPDRTALQSGDGVRFLFVGRLVHRKRPLQFLRAFSAIAGDMPDAKAMFVGDGPLRERLAEEAAPLGDRVQFAGRAEGDELRQIYASADVLVVPAVREVWGLAVNEGLAAGLFVIATDEVGSAADLVRDGNGVIIHADDLEELRRALTLVQSIDRSAAARVRRARSIEHCTPRRFALDMRRAAALALGSNSMAAAGIEKSDLT